MNMEVVGGQEAGGRPRLVTQQEAPETPIAIDVVDFSDVELIEHAEAGLGDALDVMTAIENVMDTSNADAATIQHELAKLSLQVQPPERHAAASVAASRILANRHLERIASALEKGNSKGAELTDRVLQTIEKLERIAGVLERAEALATKEMES